MVNQLAQRRVAPQKVWGAGPTESYEDKLGKAVQQFCVTHGAAAMLARLPRSVVEEIKGCLHPQPGWATLDPAVVERLITSVLVGMVIYVALDAVLMGLLYGFS